MPRQFLRVLQPLDPWLDDGPGSSEARVANLAGQYPTISVVLMNAGCDPTTALASFYGTRRPPDPARFGYVLLDEDAIVAAGGRLSQTATNLGWPPEYSAAHHDIGDEALAVAQSLFDRAHGQLQKHFVERAALYRRLFELDDRPDVHPSFRANAIKRAQRLFTQERDLWEELAAHTPHLREHCAAKLAKEARPS